MPPLCHHYTHQNTKIKDLTPLCDERAWVSLDASTMTGGASSINGVELPKNGTQSLGLTLGYQVNDNMNLTFTYKSTINDSAPDAMRSDMFMISLIAGWHPIIEGSNRLQGK